MRKLGIKKYIEKFGFLKIYRKFFLMRFFQKIILYTIVILMLRLDFEEVSIDSVHKMNNMSIDKFNSGTSRHYAFTSFKQVTHEHYQKRYELNKHLINFLIVGYEICPETKRVHMQGFIQLKDKIRYAGLKKMLNMDAHITEMYQNSTPEKNIIYCSKGGNFKTYGELSTQGKRNDLKEALAGYETLQDFIRNAPELYSRYRGGIKEYYNLKNSDYIPTDYKPIVIWLYGPTGKGKTRTINDYIKLKIQEGYRAWKAPLTEGGAWFDNYNGQDLVFLDEVRAETFQYRNLLQLLDRDCPQVPVKGGFVDFRPKIILITSCYSPEDIYNGFNEEDKQQLIRRCDVCRKVIRYTDKFLEKLDNL